MTASILEMNPTLDAARALLNAVQLPSSDLTAEHLKHFLYCGSRDALTGLVGLEIYAPDALLRSLAVAPTAQHAGMGSVLVRRAERYASVRGARSLYLLTTTARGFFEKHGYQLITREDCPASIRATAEFASLCPASSTLMKKSLI